MYEVQQVANPRRDNTPDIGRESRSNTYGEVCELGGTVSFGKETRSVSAPRMGYRRIRSGGQQNGTEEVAMPRSSVKLHAWGGGSSVARGDGEGARSVPTSDSEAVVTAVKKKMGKRSRRKASGIVMAGN